MSRIAPRQRGLTLLELLVAIAVMAMSLVLLHRVEAGAVQGIGDFAWQQRADLLAQSLLDSRDAVPATGVQESGESGGLAWSVATTPLPPPADLPLDAPRLHELRVAVSWVASSGSRRLELATLLPQALPRPGEKAP